MAVCKQNAALFLSQSPGVDDLEQIRIFDQLFVRCEDRSLLPDQPLPEAARAASSCPFAAFSIAAETWPRSDLNSRASSVTPIIPRRNLKDLTDCESREQATPNSKSGSVDLRCDSVIPVQRLVAGAGAGVQPSSPRPWAITGVILSTAARASGPLARRCTIAPLRTSSAMIAVMLRAFAC
jgi:hypothetical protein